MDIATLVGLLVGFGLIVWAIMSKSDLGNFIDSGSVAIVIGGSVAALLVCNPLKDFLGMAKVIKNAFFTKSSDAQKLIQDLVGYAEVARRDGILALEGMMRDIDDDFIVRGVQMAVDGTDPELIQEIMACEVETLAERHSNGKAILDALGRYAPAFGMIGTLIGLVCMLQDMDDPSKIGPGMAVALLTTMYGALLANLVALPLADKLAIRSAEELLHKAIIVRGVMSIQSGDNPRIVEQKLKTFLPPALRGSEDDGEERA